MRLIETAPAHILDELREYEVTERPPPQGTDGCGSQGLSFMSQAFAS